MKKRDETKAKRICKCECGGTVRGVQEFGRLFTWCEKCTPVVAIKIEVETKSSLPFTIG